MARIGNAVDPLRNYKFKVDIESFDKIGFSKVSGLTEETEVVEYREGNEALTVRKLPGMTNYEAIVLESGLAKSTDMITWRKQVINIQGSKFAANDGDSGSFRKTMTIFINDRFPSSGTNYNWTINQCWPSKLEYSEFSATANEVVLETLEIQHEGWIRS